MLAFEFTEGWAALLAFVGAVLAGVGGVIAGSLVTAKAAREQRDADRIARAEERAAADAARTEEHERAAAAIREERSHADALRREERDYARRSTIYVELLGCAHRLVTLMQLVAPEMRTGDIDELTEQVKTLGVLGQELQAVFPEAIAFGSHAVMGMARDFIKTVLDLGDVMASDLSDRARDRRDATAVTNVEAMSDRLASCLGAATEEFARLSLQINDELTNQRPASRARSDAVPPS